MSQQDVLSSSGHSRLTALLYRNLTSRTLVFTVPSSASTAQAPASTSLESATSTAKPTISIKTELKPDIKTEILPVVPAEDLQELEKKILITLNDFSLTLPVDVNSFRQNILKTFEGDVPLSTVEDMLQKFAAQLLIRFVVIMNYVWSTCLNYQGR